MRIPLSRPLNNCFLQCHLDPDPLQRIECSQMRFWNTGISPKTRLSGWVNLLFSINVERFNSLLQAVEKVLFDTFCEDTCKNQVDICEITVKKAIFESSKPLKLNRDSLFGWGGNEILFNSLLVVAA